MPTLEEARARADERRRTLLAHAAATRLAASPSPPAATELAPVVRAEPYVGPPLDPDLEETLAQNPGLGALIASMNPGTAIPGVTAPPRASPLVVNGQVQPRPHYLDGRHDVAALAARPRTPDTLGEFRPGGLFAPTPGASSQPMNISSPELSALVKAIHATNASRPEEDAGKPAPEGTPIPSREMQVLAHLAVGKSMTIAGIVTFERVDVATFVVRASSERLARSHEVDQRARVLSLQIAEQEAYIFQIAEREAYIVELEAQLANGFEPSYPSYPAHPAPDVSPDPFPARPSAPAEGPLRGGSMEPARPSAPASPPAGGAPASPPQGAGGGE